MVSARSRNHPARRRPAVVLPFLILASLPQLLPAAESLATVQQAASEWANLRAETVRLQTDWQWQRDTLEASLSALQARIATLERERDTIRATIQRESGSSSSIEEKNAAAQEAIAAIEERLETFLVQLDRTRPFLPPRLSEALELPFRSIRDAELGPAERVQHLITIFNRCSLFNKSITVGEEALALDGSERPRLHEVIYWGLAYGYALDRSGDKAYFGHPGEEGWVWELRANAAATVAQLLTIHEEQGDPAFVEIPTQVTEPFNPSR